MARVRVLVFGFDLDCIPDHTVPYTKNQKDEETLIFASRHHFTLLGIEPKSSTSCIIAPYGSSNEADGEQGLIPPSTMSFESSVSRTGVPASIGDAKRLKIQHSNDSVASFADIPTECNVRILQFLDVDDLANIAQVSRIFYEDSLHPSLPQNRTATLTCVPRMDESTSILSASPFLLLLNLSDKALSGHDRRFNKIKIIGHNLLENSSIREVRGVLPGSLGMLQHAEVLDLSFPSNALRRDKELKLCIPVVLSLTMPYLCELDLSHANASELALHHFCMKCPALEKVIWNNHGGVCVGFGVT